MYFISPEVNEGAIGFGVDMETQSSSAIDVFTAKNSSAGLVRVDNGEFTWNADTGLTADTTYTPTERFRITATGNVGIGTTNPTAKLDVAGNIKVGNDNATCTTANAGEIRYDTTSNKHQGCNGSAWNNLYQRLERNNRTYLRTEQTKYILQIKIQINILL